MRPAPSTLRLLGAVALIALSATLFAADVIRIVPLVRDSQVLVSFELADGYTEDVRAAIHSGLRTTFTYTVELRLDVPIWIDRTIATAVVSNTVQYDNLTRRHSVQRTLVGRVEQARVTVRATARPSNGSLFWPWASGPTGQAKFTFIP